MSYTARRQAAIKNIELSAKCLPGQMLGRCSESVRCISENMLDILTGVRNQMLQSPGPSHLD
jgi:hypothetical protein